MSLSSTTSTEDHSAEVKSLALIAEIERIGLEPFHAPEPLPLIQPEDVHLICWMAIEAEWNHSRPASC